MRQRHSAASRGETDGGGRVRPSDDERIVSPGDDFISVLASGEKQGVFTRHEVLVNTSLLLLAGHETMINLLCNGTLTLMQHPDQWALLKEDPAVARVEGQEVFKALAERFPNLQVEREELEYQPSITFRSLKSLPVTWQ